MASMEEQRLKKWMDVLHEPDTEMSKIAADKLGEIGNKQAVPELIEAMEKRTALVAAAAAIALGKIGDRSSIPVLIKTLRRHQDVVVQSGAAEALGMMRAEEAVPALKAVVQDYLNKYKNDRFNLTRGFQRGLFTTCIQSLKQIGTRDAIRFAENAESAG